MKLLLPKQPIFTISQFQRLSNIFDNAGQVVFGIAVVSPIISKTQINPFIFIFSGIFVILCGLFSIWLTKRGDQDDI